MRKFFVAAAAAFFMLVAVASAAKPVPVAYSISLDQAAPSIGDLVTFTVSPDPTPTLGQIGLSCFQGGVLVFKAQPHSTSGWYGYHQPFLLGPTYLWTSGSADCTATLSVVVGPKLVVVASTSFTAAG